MSELINERVTDLEIKLSYHEQTIDELNQIVIRQQKEIQILNEYLKSLSNKVNLLKEEINDKMEHELPPHY